MNDLFDIHGFILNEEYGKYYFDGEPGEGDPDRNVEPTDDETKLYTEEDLKKAIKRRDNALKRAQNAEAKLEELEKRLKEVPSLDEYESLKESYTELQEKMKEIEEKQFEEKLKKIEDEKEREKVLLGKQYKEEKQELERQLRELNERINSFTEERDRYKTELNRYKVKGLEADLKGAALKYKAYNPTQVMKLVKDDFVYDEKEGEWFHIVYDRRGNIADVQTVDEYVKAFLEDPENENLLSTTIQPGPGSPRSSSTRTDVRNTGDVTEDMILWAKKQGITLDMKNKDDRAWLIKTYRGLTSPGEVNKGE